MYSTTQHPTFNDYCIVLSVTALARSQNTESKLYKDFVAMPTGHWACASGLWGSPAWRAEETVQQQPEPEGGGVEASGEAGGRGREEAGADQEAEGGDEDSAQQTQAAAGFNGDHSQGWGRRGEGGKEWIDLYFAVGVGEPFACARPHLKLCVVGVAESKERGSVW